MRVAIAVMFAIAAIAPMSMSAQAAGKNKLCMATSLDNKKVSFKCKAAEKCCFDAIANKGNCVAAGQLCL